MKRTLTPLFFFLIFRVAFSQCNMIIDQDFNHWSDRAYTVADAKSDFNNQVKPWTASTYRGLVAPGADASLIGNVKQETRIVNGELRAEYTKDDAGGYAGGFLFDPYFDGVEEAYLEYKVKFDKDFFWATGGKLPGLGGSSSGVGSETTGRGTIPSGCKYNTNGWSARLMWRRNRDQTNTPYLILYSYFAERENGDMRVDGDCGDGKRIYTGLEDDKWYTIRQYIKLNTPGQKDGTVVMWINGVETYRDTQALIRNAGKGNLKINALIMNTYRGGSRTDPVWHSPRDEYAFFDDFKVWTGCSEPSSSSSSQVIWSADPNESTNENDFFRRFDRGNYPTDYCYSVGDEAGVDPSTVSVVNDPEYGKVWKVNKPKNRKRGEFARTEGDVNYYAPAEGDDIYIGWRWKVDREDDGDINNGVAVWQWKSAGAHDQNYPMSMYYDGELTLNAYGPDYANNSSQSSMRTVLWRKTIPQDTWVTFVVRVKLSRDDFGGIVEFWFNGVKQQLTNEDFNKYQVNLSADKYTAYHRTNDGDGVYPKWGIYNKNSCQYNANAYFHDMKIGLDLNSVLPSGSTSNQAPTVVITSPANNATYTLGDAIPLAATASDLDGNLDKVNFKVNDSYYSNDRTAPFTGSFTPTEGGTYKIAARAFDTDNEQTEVFVNVTVLGPNQAPTGSFVLPTASAIDEGYSDLLVEVDASDPDGDAFTATLFIDGNEVRTESNAPYEWGHANSPDLTETLGLTEGDHLFEVVIEDEHGLSTTISKTITVNRVNQAPEIGFVFPSDGEVFEVDEEIVVRVLATDDIAVDRINFKLNGAYHSQDATGEADEFTTTYVFDSAGTYTIGARAFDDEGASTEIAIQIVVEEGLITSLITMADGAVVVYPNPSAGVFHLQKAQTWKVFNMLGENITEGNGTTVTIPNAQSGIYLLKLSNTVIHLVVE